jgi:hypothetical protein
MSVLVVPLFGLIFDPEEGGCTFLRFVCELLPDFASHQRIRHSSLAFTVSACKGSWFRSVDVEFCVFWAESSSFPTIVRGTFSYAALSESEPHCDHGLSVCLSWCRAPPRAHDQILITV